MFLSVISTLFGENVVIWAAITVAAFIFFKRRRGRAERLMLTGASLKLVSHGMIIPYYFIYDWLVVEGNDIALGASIHIASAVLLGLVGMAGLIFLIYGFWIKFQESSLTLSRE